MTEMKKNISGVPDHGTVVAKMKKIKEEWQRVVWLLAEHGQFATPQFRDLEKDLRKKYHNLQSLEKSLR